MRRTRPSSSGSLLTTMMSAVSSGVSTWPGGSMACSGSSTADGVGSGSVGVTTSVGSSVGSGVALPSEGSLQAAASARVVTTPATQARLPRWSPLIARPAYAERATATGVSRLAVLAPQPPSTAGACSSSTALRMVNHETTPPATSIAAQMIIAER